MARPGGPLSVAAAARGSFEREPLPQQRETHARTDCASRADLRSRLRFPHVGVALNEVKGMRGRAAQALGARERRLSFPSLSFRTGDPREMTMRGAHVASATKLLQNKWPLQVSPEEP